MLIRGCVWLIATMLIVLPVAYRWHRPVGNNDADFAETLRIVGSKIEFESLERDLGAVPVDPTKPFNTIFRFRNAGEAQLRITGIEHGCLCLQPSVHPLVVKPGDSGEVRLALKRVSPRPNEATVTLHTNDPVAPTVRLKVKWRSSAPVEFEPYSLNFGAVFPDEFLERDVAVVMRSDAAKLGAIECRPAAAIDAQWCDDGFRRSVAGGARRLRIGLRPGSDPGERHGQIALSVADSSSSELVLPVQWHVRHRIEVSPSQLFLGTGCLGSEFSGTVSISVAGAERLRHCGFSLIPATGAAATIVRSSDKVLVIRVKARLPDDEGTQAWRLVVECTRPVAKAVNIPVTAFIVRRP